MRIVLAGGNVGRPEAAQRARHGDARLTLRPASHRAACRCPWPWCGGRTAGSVRTVTPDDGAAGPRHRPHDGQLPATDGMLVGREHELKVVEEFVLRAASDGDALVLYGEAGVGKTVLLDAAEEAAAASGVPVIRTVGVEVETDLAYAALYRLLTPFLSRLDGLSGQQRRTLATALGLDEGPPPDRLAVSNAVLSLLGLARGDGPLLVIVDHLPWLDRMSAAVLAFVARRLAGARIGFLGAFRTGESSFFGGGGLAAVEVMPLGQTAAGSLIDGRFPALAPRARQQVLAEAAGNPLALLELPARVADRSHERQTTPALPLSQRLEHLFAARVDPLPAPTRRALLLAALDATGDLGILVAAFGANAIDDLAPAERAQLIRVNGERRRLAFRHPLMRSAVIAMSTVQQRRDLHAAIAAQMPDQPDRRAWHLAEAAEVPDESIAVLLEQTADRILRRGDAVGALSALLRAADLTPVGRDRGRRLARAAYIGAEVTGDIGSVPRLLADAQHADPGGADALAAAVATSAYLLNGEGDVNAAHRMLFGAIAAREVLDGEDNGLIEALWFLIAICVFGGRAELWEPMDGLMGRFRLVGRHRAESGFSSRTGTVSRPSCRSGAVSIRRPSSMRPRSLRQESCSHMRPTPCGPLWISSRQRCAPACAPRPLATSPH
ncbi:AAA family ATPase [Streptomyces mirabilis]|uniref:AAA family ATPase n=1 Tax=Streptomyces mirabilis TaxID=68239 RepID=UPI0033B054CB